MQENFLSNTTLKQIIESLIFASDELISVKQILNILNETKNFGENFSLTQADINLIVDELNCEYEETKRSFKIVKIGGGFLFSTLPQFSKWIGEFFKEKIKRKLSQSALETLAVIAYKQPISKPEIESIRGVNCDYMVTSLMEKTLVAIVGRAETIGRPLLYGTTEYFLKHFGINSISDLPKLKEIDELLKEAELEANEKNNSTSISEDISNTSFSTSE